jgi:hypothetical protein
MPGDTSPAAIVGGGLLERGPALYDPNGPGKIMNAGFGLLILYYGYIF